MKPDHFDVFDDDPDLGRWCPPCGLTRHADCRPHGCQATRDHEPHGTWSPPAREETNEHTFGAHAAR